MVGHVLLRHGLAIQSVLARAHAINQPDRHRPNRMFVSPTYVFLHPAIRIIVIGTKIPAGCSIF
jgi:hypothetical protein